MWVGSEFELSRVNDKDFQRNIIQTNAIYYLTQPSCDDEVAASEMRAAADVDTPRPRMMWPWSLRLRRHQQTWLSFLCHTCGLYYEI